MYIISDYLHINGYLNLCPYLLNTVYNSLNTYLPITYIYNRNQLEMCGIQLLNLVVYDVYF